MVKRLVMLVKMIASIPLCPSLCVRESVMVRPGQAGAGGQQRPGPGGARTDRASLSQTQSVPGLSVQHSNVRLHLGLITNSERSREAE